MAGLSVLATIPVLNLLSLGYLIEVSGRVARDGWRAGFPGARLAAHAGGLILGVWLCLWPLRFARSMWYSAILIDPQGSAAGGWAVAVWVIGVFTAWHVVWACLRGGRLRSFFWPAPLAFKRWLRTSGRYVAARDAVWAFVTHLHLDRLFRQGFWGLISAVVWLSVPVGLLLLASSLPEGGAVLLSLLGALVLMPIVVWLPVMQARYAMEPQPRRLFDWRGARHACGRAPLACSLALVVTLAASLPLYLLKIELTPQEVAWLPSLLFVIFLWPARLIFGWAIGRAERCEAPAHGFWRWSTRLAIVPVIAAYAGWIYLTQYLSWYGTWSLLEQHAFGVPAPVFSF